MDMKSIIEQLTTQQIWEELLAYRLKKGRFNWQEFEQTDSFVEGQQYLPLAQQVVDGGSLSIPRKQMVNKLGTNKKRIVYSFKPEEMLLLKVLSHLLYKYDAHFAENCYAFRRGIRVSDAVRRIYRSVRKRGLWAYKLDIHNYFNSISIPILLPQLKLLMADDPQLYNFFERLLSDDRCEYEGTIIHEQRGAMAGIPVSSFLANVYLSEMDHYFKDQGVIYARYSDDIIIFAEDLEQLQFYREKILDFLHRHKLEVNPTKEKIYSPNDPYDFLGFRCGDDYIDISPSGVDKMKGKIRRKSRALLRRKQRKGLSNDCVMSDLIRYFNRKFFDNNLDNTLTWSRWFFPVISSTAALREIDHYMQQSIRVLATGRHNKSNYRITYAQLKSLGYKSLVHAFYEQREMEAD